MSHLPYRSETNCLNCDTEVIGAFCHHCGQENIEPKESVWHLVNHFLNDITHFDGKLFSTLKILITKPGFLSKEYSKGRRMTYLNPIRMYVFISAVFFFVFFALVSVKQNTILTQTDSGKSNSLKYNLYKNKNGSKPLMTEKQFFDSLAKKKSLSVAPIEYKSRAQYDSALKAGERHNWLVRQMEYKKIDLRQKYGKNDQLLLEDLVNKFFHLLPQMFFFLLPLFALILKMVYVRNKQLYFTDHGIFTIHFYVYLFISFILIILINRCSDSIHLPSLKYISGLISLGLFFYFYKAMRNYYKQGRGKTILKYVFVLATGFIITLFTFIGFVFLSVFEI